MKGLSIEVFLNCSSLAQGVNALHSLTCWLKIYHPS